MAKRGRPRKNKDVVLEGVLESELGEDVLSTDHPVFFPDVVPSEIENHWYRVEDLAREIMLAVTSKVGAFNPDYAKGAFRVAVAYAAAAGWVLPDDDLARVNNLR